MTFRLLCGGGRPSTECLFQNMQPATLPFGSQGANVYPSSAGVSCSISRGEGLERFTVMCASLS